jgi:cobaltochelatase CobS
MTTCQICEKNVNFIYTHLEESHPETSIEEYVKTYPKAPLMDETHARLVEEKLKQWANKEKRFFDIKSVFEIKPFGSTDQVWGWDKPCIDTPPIESGYSFRRDLLAVILFAVENFNEPALLIGPTGSGKTSVIEQVAARLNRTVTRINLDGDVTRSDLVGQWVLSGENVMTYHYGPLAKAMQSGDIMIIDEIDAGAAPVVMVVQAVLEGKPLMLLETGETIHPHPDFRLFATANTNGQGDESGMYHGTQPQNYALMDRFKLVSIVDYPKKAEEHKILEKRLGMNDDDGLRSKLIEVANLIRKSHVKGDCVCTMSTRNIINIAEKMLVFGDIKMAYSVSFLNKLNIDDRDFCNEIIQRIWG